MSLLLLHSSVLFYHVDLGRLEAPPGWLSSKICCMECGAVIFKLSGVICGNFGCDCGLGLGTCLSAGHSKCYKQHVQDNFPVLRMQDLDDTLTLEEDLEEDDPARF
jgi:hypothetical protein